MRRRSHAAEPRGSSPGRSQGILAAARHVADDCSAERRSRGWSEHANVRLEALDEQIVLPWLLAELSIATADAVCQGIDERELRAQQHRTGP